MIFGLGRRATLYKVKTSPTGCCRRQLRLWYLDAVRCQWEQGCNIAPWASPVVPGAGRICPSRRWTHMPPGRSSCAATFAPVAAAGEGNQAIEAFIPACPVGSVGVAKVTWLTWLAWDVSQSGRQGPLKPCARATGAVKMVGPVRLIWSVGAARAARALRDWHSRLAPEPSAGALIFWSCRNRPNFWTYLSRWSD